MDGFVSGAIMLFIVLCLGIVLVVKDTYTSPERYEPVVVPWMGDNHT